MAASNIACNIKRYPHHVETILKDYGKGMQHAQVYAGGLSMADISLSLPVNTYFAFMFGGMLRKMGCKIRPYDNEPGETDRVLSQAVDILEGAFLKNRTKEAAVAEVVALFENISTRRTDSPNPKPKAAIFGDFYVRDNRTLNQDLIDYIEARGGEVLTFMRCRQTRFYPISISGLSIPASPWIIF